MKIKDILNRLDVISEAPAQPAPYNAAKDSQAANAPAGAAAPKATDAASLKQAQAAAAAGKPGTSTPSSQTFPTNLDASGRQTAATDPRVIKPGGAAAQPAKTPAKSDPAVKARQEELIKAGAKIKADGIPGPATTQAEKDYGQVANAAKGDTAVDNAAAIAASNASNAQANAQQRDNEAKPATPAAPTPGAPSTNAASLRANINAAASQTGTTAGPDQSAPQSPDDIARLQQLGGIPPQQTSPLQPDPTQPANPMAGVNTRPAGGYGNFTGGATNAEPGQAAQPTAAAAPAANPSAGAAPVKTGSGGTLTTRDGKPVTTRSDNEIWWSQQPGNRGKQYPGDAVAQQQYDAQKSAGQKNLNAIKSFFGGGNKQQAAAAPQPTTPAIATFESEMSMIKHLSGLK